MSRRAGQLRDFAIGIALALLLIAMQSVHAAPDPDNSLLDAMSGDWLVSGTTQGKPTTYALHGQRMLKGGFVRLDMIDTKTPPQYQATVYIGYDANKHDYIAHWLDQYGAAGARVVGEGHRNGNSLIILFPYEEGAFRDTFTYDAPAKTWSWLFESQDKTGKWSVFGKYDMRRASPH
jgi:hypothetical protein